MPLVAEGRLRGKQCLANKAITLLLCPQWQRAVRAKALSDRAMCCNHAMSSGDRTALGQSGGGKLVLNKHE